MIKAEDIRERLYLLIIEGDTDDQSPLVPFTVDRLGKRTLLLEGPMNQKFSVTVEEVIR